MSTAIVTDTNSGIYEKQAAELGIHVVPMPVIIGKATYPSGILDELRAKGVEVEEVDALSTALEAGSAKAVNIVLMARLAKRLDIPREKWIEAIGKSVAPKFVEMNEKAFTLGYDK